MWDMVVDDRMVLILSEILTVKSKFFNNHRISASLINARMLEEAKLKPKDSYSS